MYLGVSPFRRFAAFIIDMILISIVASLILFGILKIINFDFNRFNTLQENIVRNYYDLILGYSSGNIPRENMDEVVEFIKMYAFREGIRMGIVFVLYFIYLVVLPYFFKYQTLGRLATKSKVVYIKDPDQKLSFGTLALREMVGSFICYTLIGILGFISMILAIASGKSLVDRLSKTSMVIDFRVPVNEEFTTNYFTNKEENYENNNDINNDYIDAQVEEVNEETENDKNEEDNDEYRVI